jgi:Spy/CpxP family protein refolding chaperone
VQRLIAIALLFAGGVFAQMPRGFYAWWSTPVVRDLNLTKDQRQQIRGTIQDYRPRLMQLRAELNSAEEDLAAQFNRDPVDPTKANQAIERLVTARSQLTRTLSHMSLALRSVLTEQQWQELQRRRPVRNQDGKEPAPESQDR